MQVKAGAQVQLLNFFGSHCKEIEARTLRFQLRDLVPVQALTHCLLSDLTKQLLVVATLVLTMAG